MLKLNKHRIFVALALLLAAGTLSGCGCGPFGLRWCGRGGFHDGGYGGERR